MDLKEKIRILGFQPIVGYAGTEEGDIFTKNMGYRIFSSFVQWHIT